MFQMAWYLRTSKEVFWLHGSLLGFALAYQPKESLEHNDSPLSFYLFVHPFYFWNYTQHFLFACLTLFSSSALQLRTRENPWKTLFKKCGKKKSVETFFRLKWSSFKSTFILLLGLYPREMKSQVLGYTKPCILMFLTALCLIAKTGNNPDVPQQVNGSANHNTSIPWNTTQKQKTILIYSTT